MLAQELREIFPELVIEDKHGRLSVKYTSLIAPVIGSIQELERRTRTLADQNRALRDRMDLLERENSKLRADVQMILDRIRR